MPNLTLNRSTSSKASEIEAYRAEKIDAVNVRIGQVRSKFITDIPGQEGIYKTKEAEAAAYLAESPEPADLSAYPYIANEIGITAPTALELAQTWIAMSAQWSAVGADLEGLRLGVINEIRNAATRFEIDSLMAEMEIYLEYV